MKPKKQGFPINPNPGPPPIIYCVHCGTALVNGKCPKGHAQAPKGDDGRADPVIKPQGDPLYFVVHDNLPADKGWWEVRIREWDGEPNAPVAEFFADLCPNAELWARNICAELNDLAAQK